MKTAVSLPDDLFEQIEANARRMRVSRSGFFALAAREFLARHAEIENPTELWNRMLKDAGQPIDDPAAAAFQRRSKAVVRQSSKKKKTSR